jgi:3',5'-cyclic AMP phosphodiesterase CpdA
MEDLNIIHISDLHLGSTDFRPNYLENVIGYINERVPDLVVCTGDLTHKAKKSEYLGVKSYLDKIRPPLIATPGNHDAKHNGLVFFERYICPRRSQIILDDKDAIILGLRSCKDGTQEGELHDEQFRWIIDQLNRYSKKIKVLALHHHLIAVPYSGIKRSTLVDAGEAIELTRVYEIQLILMGHKHCPHVWNLGNSVFLYCGTTSSEKTRADENPCFNEITIDNHGMEINIIDSKNFNKELLFKQKDGILDFVRHRKTRIDHILHSKVFQTTY